jgi:division/cell wall cluster transcriptional repressor MraZ
MSGEFLGTFYNSVNKQKWITIPAGIKKKFAPSAKQQVVVTIGPKSNIAIYPLDNWNKKIEELSNGNEREKKLLIMLRTFASAQQKMEANGRVKIQNELLSLAQIDGKVIIKGEGNYISVWNPERYRVYTQELMKEHTKSFNTLDYQ